MPTYQPKTDNLLCSFNKYLDVTEYFGLQFFMLITTYKLKVWMRPIIPRIVKTISDFRQNFVFAGTKRTA